MYRDGKPKLNKTAELYMTIFPGVHKIYMNKNALKYPNATLHGSMTEKISTLVM